MVPVSVFMMAVLSMAETRNSMLKLKKSLISRLQGLGRSLEAEIPFYITSFYSRKTHAILSSESSKFFFAASISLGGSNIALHSDVIDGSYFGCL
jgi:hypothetical protein